MEVLAGLEKPYNAQQGLDSSSTTSGVFRLFPSQGIGFFNYSTVFPNPIRIEGQAREMLIRLERLSDLKHNWNGYGADAPSPGAIMYAKKFIIDNLRFGLPYYFTAPGVNGEVMIELKKNDRAAEIYFWEDQSSEVLLLDNEQVVLEGSLIKNYQDLLRFF
jgi:hypothetical protein